MDKAGQIQLLLINLNKMIMFQRKSFSNVDRYINKMKFIVDRLNEKSDEIQQPIGFLIKCYSYFYVDICKMKSLKYLQMKYNEFLDKFDFSNLPEFSIEDDLYSYEVEKSWNHMNSITSQEFSFVVRSELAKNGIRIGSNVWFKHNNNPLFFIKIAKFLNENKKKYPLLHDCKEFFSHLPIITKKIKEYQIIDYLNIGWSFDKYYILMYGKK